MSVEFITIDDAKGIYKDQAIITNDDGSVTAMPKSIYDEQVEHLTEIPTPSEA